MPSSKIKKIKQKTIAFLKKHLISKLDFGNKKIKYESYRIRNSRNYNFINTDKPILDQHFVFEVIKLISLKIRRM